MISSVEKETNGSREVEKPELDEKIQKVVSLMISRTRGEVSDEMVETAVSNLLSDPAAKKQESGRCPRQKQKVVVDTDDYDDLDSTTQLVVSRRKKRVRQDEDASLGMNATEIEQNDESMIDDDHEDLFDSIPLGRSGAKMMVTFGDGKNPKPEAVSAALLGTRSCLQFAIKDARALRRRSKLEFIRAKAMVKRSRQQSLKKEEKKFSNTSQEEVDQELLYRAMNKHDRLSYDPGCGFEFQQLQQLFPEEMNAYERWTQMHKAYVSSKERDDAKPNLESPDLDQVEEDSKDNATPMKVDSMLGGHLKDRLAHFDVRTEQMKDEWYLKFSEVRQGSFLPRGSGRNSAAQQWNEQRKRNRVRGRNKGSSWQSLSLHAVRFLHWVGFDLQSALPPPNEETTQALAFLAHDFMGRIVEKAVYLKSLANREAQKQAGIERNEIHLQLEEGTQLEVEDIERSLKDTTIRPVPLYSATDDASRQVAAQLYFGPGFEHRLEMEMDELVAGSTKSLRLSAAELDIRKREDELFERLKAPPVVDGYLSIVGDSEMSHNNAKKDKDAKKEQTE